MSLVFIVCSLCTWMKEALFEVSTPQPIDPTANHHLLRSPPDNPFISNHRHSFNFAPKHTKFEMPAVRKCNITWATR